MIYFYILSNNLNIDSVIFPPRSPPRTKLGLSAGCLGLVINFDLSRLQNKWEGRGI